MAAQWKIDPSHSEIQFKVKHLMITTVTGYFKQFNLEVETEKDTFDQVNSIRFSAEAGSIGTNNEQRDTHLKSADFFDAGNYSQVLFTADKYSSEGENLNGQLTIRDVTRPVVLHVEFGGMVVDPYGQTKAGFTITGKISRKDFGLTWSAVTEAGQIVVSDEVKINAEVQLVKQ